MKTPRQSKIDELLAFDRKNGSVVIGTDEAGRGPLAGPVVAGAVYFPEINPEVIEVIKFIDDSKKFSSQRIKKELSENIKSIAKYSIQECTVEEIDKLNILQASLLAMRKCCDDVIKQISADKKTLIILVDGPYDISKYNNYDYKQKAVKKGDTLSASIAAASILAKVYRDELMMELSQEFPQYCWHKNKGYPTKAHIEALRAHGECKWHRKTFLGKVLCEQKKIF